MKMELKDKQLSVKAIDCCVPTHITCRGKLVRALLDYWLCALCSERRRVAQG